MSHASFAPGPIRVPELGPPLGRIVTGTGRRTDILPLDSLRIQLATQIIEMAGEARRLAADGDRVGAVAALGADRWRQVWEDVVREVVRQVTGTVVTHLDAEARAARMPKRLRRRVAPDDAELRGMTARLGASGVEYAAGLHVLDETGRGAIEMGDPESLERWQRALARAAQRLEVAWLRLESVLDDEVARWQGVANQFAAWRRSLWPVFVVGTVLVAGAVWAGLVWGAVLDPPRWVRPVLDWLTGVVG